LRPLVDAINETPKGMADRLNVKFGLLSLGISSEDYKRFQTVTPAVSITMSGNAHPVWLSTMSGKSEDATWCVDFVTDFMLRVEAGRR
jgi:hypothetical protein